MDTPFGHTRNYISNVRQSNQNSRGCNKGRLERANRCWKVEIGASTTYNPADSKASRRKLSERIEFDSKNSSVKHEAAAPARASSHLTRVPAAALGGCIFQQNDSRRENDHEKTLVQGHSILGVAGISGNGVVRGAVESAGSAAIGCKQ
jgi:hypothetical protein